MIYHPNNSIPPSSAPYPFHLLPFMSLKENTPPFHSISIHSNPTPIPIPISRSMMGDHGGRRRIQMNDSIPDDIATECLVRIPLRFHSTLKLVSHGWRSLLSHPSFYSHRLLSGSADHLLFLVQPSDPPPSDPKPVDLRRLPDGPPAYSLAVFNLTRREWHRLALSPTLRIPMFCQLVALPSAGKILLLGGWDPDTLDPVNHVYVIDLVAGTWRRGAPMAAARSFFAVSVAADGKTQTTVYVAGGHDGQKNALKSAEAYDVEGDEWAPLPPMEEERDECLGMAAPFGRGFLVVSGYATDSQGRFRHDAEWFDPEQGRWSRVEGVWPWEGSSPRATAVVDRGRWWWWADQPNGGEVKEFDWEEMGWKAGRKLKIAGGSRCVVDVGEEGVVVMGNAGDGPVLVVEGHQQAASVVETPPDFLGIPFSTCHLRV